MEGEREMQRSPYPQFLFDDFNFSQFEYTKKSYDPTSSLPFLQPVDMKKSLALL